MAYKRIILDSAENERDRIVKHLIAETGCTSPATRFLDAIDREVDVVSEFPTLHALSRMPELAEKGYRAALVGNYVMLYTFSEDTVFIAHIFHQCQDYASLV